MNVIIYAACLPAARPLFVLFVEKVLGYASGKGFFFGHRPRKDGFDMDNEAHELRPKGIERAVNVVEGDIDYDKLDEEQGQSGNLFGNLGGVSVSERQIV